MKRIIITETDDGVEVEQFLIDNCGDLHKDESEHFMDIHHFFHQAIREVKMKHIKAKKEKK